MSLRRRLAANVSLGETRPKMPSEPSSDSALQEPLLLHSDEEPSTSGRQAPEPLAVRHASPVQALTSRLQALLRYVISRWSDFLRLVRDAYRRLAELGTGPRSLQLSRVQQDRLQVSFWVTVGSILRARSIFHV